MVEKIQRSDFKGKPVSSRENAACNQGFNKKKTAMLHDAVVVRNYLEIGSEWAVLIPCDNRKDATGAAQFLNSMIREAELAESRNGEDHGLSPKEEKLIVLPPVPEAAEP